MVNLHHHHQSVFFYFLLVIALLLFPTTVQGDKVAAASWTLATLSQAWFGDTATLAGNLAFFMGGIMESSGYSNAVNFFNASSWTWSTSGPLSVPRVRSAATTVYSPEGDHPLVICAGGSNNSLVTQLAQVDVFNVRRGKWTTATLLQARERLAGTTVVTKALFAGGVVGSSNSLAVIDVYNTMTGLWTTMSLSQSCYQLMATTVGDVAIFAGGMNDEIGLSNMVDIYNAMSDQ